VLTLLNAGYSVRTTVRKLNRQNEVIEALKHNNADGIDNLSFVEADLASDSNWNQAVKDCKYLLHVASPIGIEKPQNESEFIGPAVDGTLRVLRAARDAGVKRVVLTSSFGAIGYGHKPTVIPFTEESWTNPNDRGISPYIKSKTLAERAAWDFIKKEGR